MVHLVGFIIKKQKQLHE